ncbi:MAG: hypothetical protein HKN04_15015 [Rhodothermaceae bacterium]|nr:hypothetical protein [Rhodothermaceae bacterium]
MTQSSDGSILLAYLDPYHLGDPLFLSSFVRDVKAHTGPLLLVHGGGEEAERALEAQGLVPERVDGALQVADARQAALVERATRDLNRRIVHELNEVGVAAIRLTGADRGVLRRQADGALTAREATWLRMLMEQGAVPVLATMIEDGSGLVEVNPAAVCVALAHVMSTDERAVTVVAFSTGRRARLVMDGAEQEAVSVDQISGIATVPAPDFIVRVVSKGVRCRVVTPAALRGTGLPEGTVILA